MVHPLSQEMVFKDVVRLHYQPQGGVASLTLLVSWEVWNEINARVFRRKHTPSFILLSNKKEARLWVIAGAKKKTCDK
jgi:hypothetical protein